MLRILSKIWDMMKKQETGLADGTSERANFGGLARYIVGTSSSRAHQSQKTSSQAAKIKKKISPLLLPDLSAYLRMKDTIRLITEHSIHPGLCGAFPCRIFNLFMRMHVYFAVMESLFLEWQRNNHLLLYCLEGTSHIHIIRRPADWWFLSAYKAYKELQRRCIGTRRS